MSQYVQRVLAALAWVDRIEEPRRRDMTWAVLVVVLWNMLRRPGSQTDVLATDGYVARDLGIDRDGAGDAIRRMIHAGVLDDITGTPAAEKVRNSRQSTEPLPDNARVVRLGRLTEEREPAGEGNENPQGVSREPAGGEREPAQLSDVLLKEPRRGSLEVGDFNYARGTGMDHTTVPDLREWLGAVEPTSEVWKTSHALGPKAQRAYGYLLGSPRPVLPRHLRDDLGISRKRAGDLLKDLAAHGLAQRGDSGWIPGPLTPSQVSKPSEAPKVPQRGPESQEETSMPELVMCQACSEWADTTDCPHCGYSPEPEPTPATPSKPKVTRTDLPNNPRLTFYSLDGREIRSVGAEEFYSFSHRSGSVQTFKVADGKTVPTSRVFYPQDRDYPNLGNHA